MAMGSLSSVADEAPRKACEPPRRRLVQCTRERTAALAGRLPPGAAAVRTHVHRSPMVGRKSDLVCDLSPRAKRPPARMLDRDDGAAECRPAGDERRGAGDRRRGDDRADAATAPAP